MCDCKIENLIVREGFVRLHGMFRTGQVEAQCPVCGTVYLVNIETGEKERKTK